MVVGDTVVNTFPEYSSGTGGDSRERRFMVIRNVERNSAVGVGAIDRRAAEMLDHKNAQRASLVETHLGDSTILSCMLCRTCFLSLAKELSLKKRITHWTVGCKKNSVVLSIRDGST